MKQWCCNPATMQLCYIIIGFRGEAVSECSTSSVKAAFPFEHKIAHK